MLHLFFAHSIQSFDWYWQGYDNFRIANVNGSISCAKFVFKIHCNDFCSIKLCEWISYSNESLISSEVSLIVPRIAMIFGMVFSLIMLIDLPKKYFYNIDEI